MATELAAVVEEDEAPVFGEVRIPSHYLIRQGDRDYLLSDGLLVGLDQLSRGHYDLTTEIVQLPTAENGHLAVVRATVVVFDPESGAVLRRATGIGDASPGSVTKMVAPHLLRMAETRSVARACRHVLGLGVTALEELGEDSAGETRAPAAPVSSSPPVEGITIEGKRWTRPQIEAAWRVRRAEAERLGVALPTDVATLVAEQAPLPVLVGATQALRRLTEATQAGQR